MIYEYNLSASSITWYIAGIWDKQSAFWCFALGLWVIVQV